MDVVFYVDARGRTPVIDYIGEVAQQRPAEAAAIQRYVDSLEQRGDQLAMPYARLIDPVRRVFELRPGPHRIAYAFHARKYVLLHAWRKTQQRLDARALRRAQARLDDWIKREGPA